MHISPTPTHTPFLLAASHQGQGKGVGGMGACSAWALQPNQACPGGVRRFTHTSWWRKAARITCNRLFKRLEGIGWGAYRSVFMIMFNKHKQRNLALAISACACAGYFHTSKKVIIDIYIFYQNTFKPIRISLDIVMFWLDRSRVFAMLIMFH